MTFPAALPILVPVVLPGISGLLLIGLIVLVSIAMNRSAKRLECARLRDELVDAARLGELDVSDARVFWLIDWFDRVAATGRLITSGRHATERPDSTSLTASLTHALTSDGRRPIIGPSWPSGASWPTGPSWQSELFGASGGRDVKTRAVRYQKRKLRQRQDAPRHSGGLDVTGHAKPPGALMPVSGAIPLGALLPLIPMDGPVQAGPPGRLLPVGPPPESAESAAAPVGLRPGLAPRVDRSSRTVVAPRSPLAPRHAGRTARDAERDVERTARDAERDLGRAGHNALKDQIFAVAAQAPR